MKKANVLPGFLLVLTALVVLSACSSSKDNLACSKKRHYHAKKYKKRKYKNYTPTQRPMPHSGSEPYERAQKTESKNEDTAQKPAENKGDENVPESIPDTKLGGPPKEEKVVEFKGDAINISEEKTYTFEESIEFINVSDLFVNREAALNSLKDLSKLLKQDKDIHVTIIGNTASTIPQEGSIYGASPEVYAQIGELNGRPAFFGEIMLARARRVYDLLASSGVSKKQMRIKKGSHRKYAKDRTVTFELSTKENE